MVVACSMFCGKLIGAFRFSRRGEYIGRRAASGSGPGGLTSWWRGPGLGCVALGCGQVLSLPPPPSLLWTPTHVLEK
jgi:hypothetical protein